MSEAKNQYPAFSNTHEAHPHHPRRPAADALATLFAGRDLPGVPRFGKLRVGFSNRWQPKAARLAKLGWKNKGR